jgi:hypothetical protein
MSESESIVARFSCGAASAVAAKIAIARWGDRVEVVNAFIAAEHPDNRRFLADCEKWLGRKVTVLRDTKHAADPVAVWISRRFIASRSGAPCSKAIKGDILDDYRPDSTMVIGYTADESSRFDRFIDANATKRVIAPLIEEGMTKDDCYRVLADAGLVLPVPYRLGFSNSNCLLCPKGGLGYWNHVRKHYPENFERVAAVQDLLGPGSWFLSDRRDGGRVRISLRALRPDMGKFSDEPPVSCGGLCELPDTSMREVES